MIHKFVKMLGDFEKLRVLHVESNEYSALGMSAVARHLRINGYITQDTLPVGFMPLINASSGKIATRVAKWVSASTPKSLTAKDKEEVGNIASRYISTLDDMLFDFHDGVLDWPEGDFGNSNSCWRKSYAASMPMLREGSGYGQGFAMRLFSPNRSKGKGIYYGGVGGYGRLWLLPYKNSLVVFNPYGQKIEWFLDRLLKIMSEGTNEKLFSKFVKLTNSNDGMYANGNSAIITTGKKAKSKDVETNMPQYLTKVCNVCRKNYARKPNEEPSREQGYCQECGESCIITGEINPRERMLLISSPIIISHRGRDKTVSNGYISSQFENQVEYCVLCAEYHGTEGCKKRDR